MSVPRPLKTTKTSHGRGMGNRRKQDWDQLLPLGHFKVTFKTSQFYIFYFDLKIVLNIKAVNFVRYKLYCYTHIVCNIPDYKIRKEGTKDQIVRSKCILQIEIPSLAGLITSPRIKWDWAQCCLVHIFYLLLPRLLGIFAQTATPAKICVITSFEQNRQTAV